MSSPLRRIAANAAWLAAGEVIIKGALFLAAAVVARGMGPSGMGVFTVAYGAALVLTQLLAAGQVEVLIRETASAPEAGPALFSGARRWQAKVAIVVLPLVTGGALLFAGPDYVAALVAFIPYAWLRARLISATAVFKGLDRMEVEVVGRGIEVMVALAALGVAAVCALPVWTAGLAFTLGALVGSSAVVTKLRRLGGRQVAAFGDGLVRHGLPFVGLALVNQMLMRSDSFMLAALGVAAGEIGRYGAATAPVWGLVAVAQLAAVAIYPTLSRFAAHKQLRMGHTMMIGCLGWILGAALALVLTVVREPLTVLVFGAQFRGAAEILAVVAWVLPWACGTMVLGVAVAALRRQVWALRCQGVLLLAAAPGFLLAIPRFGVAGCAWTLVALQAAAYVTTLALALVATLKPGDAAPIVAPLPAEP